MYTDLDTPTPTCNYPYRMLPIPSSFCHPNIITMPDDTCYWNRKNYVEVQSAPRLGQCLYERIWKPRESDFRMVLSSEVLMLPCVVGGYHVYKAMWDLYLGDDFSTNHVRNNPHNKSANCGCEGGKDSPSFTVFCPGSLV